MLDSSIFEYRQVLSNKVDSAAELSAAFFQRYLLFATRLCAVRDNIADDLYEGSLCGTPAYSTIRHTFIATVTSR